MEMAKEGENKMTFTNFHKQMKAPYVVYAYFECVPKKISSCELDDKKSFTVKTEKHEPCGFSYMVVRSDAETFGSFTHRGEDAVFAFIAWLQNHEREMREDMANKRPLVMTMKTGKNTGTLSTATPAIKDSSKTSSWTPSLCTTQTPGNIAGKATEDAASWQENTLWGRE